MNYMYLYWYCDGIMFALYVFVSALIPYRCDIVHVSAF